MERNKSVKLGEKLQRCISLFPIQFLNSFIYVFYCGYIIKNISITNSEKIGTFLSFNVFNYYFTLLSFEWLWWRTNCEVYLTLLKVQNSCIPSIFQIDTPMRPALGCLLGRSRSLDLRFAKVSHNFKMMTRDCAVCDLICVNIMYGQHSHWCVV